jgi:hypothetical protein
MLLKDPEALLHISHFFSIVQDVCGTSVLRVVLRAAFGRSNAPCEVSIATSTPLSQDLVLECAAADRTLAEKEPVEAAAADTIRMESPLGTAGLVGRTDGCISLVFGIYYRNFEFALGRAEALAKQNLLREAVTKYMPLCILR